MSKLNLKVAALPQYTLKLPISGTTHKFRPFLVREEKVLLMASQTKDETQINDAIRNLLLSCTNGEVDTKKLCVADAEYAFLQIRCKSVGEEVKPQATCLGCNTATSIKIKLDDIKITPAPKPVVKETIQLSESLGLIMRHPTIHDVNSTKNALETAFDLAYSCVSAVIIDDQVHQREDLDEKELSEFIDSLLPSQFQQVMEFVNSAPMLNYNFNYTCPSCKKLVSVDLQSISDFFQ